MAVSMVSSSKGVLIGPRSKSVGGVGGCEGNLGTMLVVPPCVGGPDLHGPNSWTQTLRRHATLGSLTWKPTGMEGRWGARRGGIGRCQYTVTACMRSPGPGTKTKVARWWLTDPRLWLLRGLSLTGRAGLRPWAPGKCSCGWPCCLNDGLKMGVETVFGRALLRWLRW